MKHLSCLSIGLLSSIAGCQQGQIPENAYRVEKIEYIGNSAPGEILVTKKGSPFAAFIRIVHLLDREGNRTIMIGEPNDQNTRTIYHGITDGEMEFMVLNGEGQPYKGLLADSIIRIPTGIKRISLLGSRFSVEEISEDSIRCRVISVGP